MVYLVTCPLCGAAGVVAVQGPDWRHALCETLRDHLRDAHDVLEPASVRAALTAAGCPDA